jgi:hypothetical protein
VKTWWIEDGYEALQLERAVLSWWRDLSAVVPRRDDVPGGIGFSECVYTDRVDVPQTIAFVEAMRSGIPESAGHTDQR